MNISLFHGLLDFLQYKCNTFVGSVSKKDREGHDVSVINFQRPVSIPTSTPSEYKSLNLHFKMALLCVQKCLPEGTQPDTHGIHDQVRPSTEFQNRED